MEQWLNKPKMLLVLTLLILVGLSAFQINWLLQAYQFKQEYLEKELDDLATQVAIQLDVAMPLGQPDYLAKHPEEQLEDIQRKISALVHEKDIGEDVFFAIYQEDNKGMFLSNDPTSEEALRSSPHRACLSCIMTLRFAEDSIKAQTPEMTFVRSISEYERLPSSPPREQFLFLSLYLPDATASVWQSMIGFGLATLIFAGLLLWIFWHILRSTHSLQRLNTLQKDFFTNMTHEFKTPLSSIGLASRMLLKQESDARSSNYLQLIANESSKLSQQVDKILYFSHVSGEEIAFEKGRIPIRELVEESIARLRLIIEQKEAHIITEFESAELEIEVDRTHFSNCLYNLIDNALKYTGAHPTIHIRTYTQAQNAYISVQDNGPGIAPQHRAHIFDRFYRIQDKDQYRGKGFGIGLSYVKSVLEGHGGQISLKQQNQSGAAFLLTLPLTAHA